MNSNLLPGSGAGTIFQAAKRIVAEFLRTLSSQDYVNIIVFDSTRVIQLSPSAVILKPSYYQIILQVSYITLPLLPLLYLLPRACSIHLNTLHLFTLLVTTTVRNYVLLRF